MNHPEYILIKQKKALNELQNKGLDNDDNFVYGEIVNFSNISRHLEHSHISLKALKKYMDSIQSKKEASTISALVQVTEF